MSFKVQRNCADCPLHGVRDFLPACSPATPAKLIKRGRYIILSFTVSEGTVRQHENPVDGFCIETIRIDDFSKGR